MLELPDLPNPILAQHQHPQVDQGLEAGYVVQPEIIHHFTFSTTVDPKCFPPVVVEVEEDEPTGHFQVVDPFDEVVLETVRGI